MASIPDSYSPFEELQGNSLFYKQYTFFLHACVRMWDSKKDLWILSGKNPLRCAHIPNNIL